MINIDESTIRHVCRSHYATVCFFPTVTKATLLGVVIISDDFQLLIYISFNAFFTKPTVHKVFYSFILSKNLFQNLMIFTPPMAPDN